MAKVKSITNFYKLLEKYVKNIWKINRKKSKKRLDICIENLYTKLNKYRDRQKYKVYISGWSV